jgi:DNA-binding LacI/PurR family transcriptional regulator
LEAEIIDRIRKGALAPGARLDSPEELTRELDASPSTIRLTLQSLASRGILVRVPRRGTMVSPQAMQMIDTARVARKGNPFALLVPDVRVPEYASLAGAVLDIVEEVEREVVVYSTDDDRNRYDVFIRRCIDQECEGLILVPPLLSHLKPDTLLEIEKSKIPVVTIWRPVDVLGAPVIRTDPSHSSNLITDHMIQAGCRKIGLITYESTVDGFEFTKLSTLHGYHRAMNAAGILAAEARHYNYPVFWGPNDIAHCESKPEFAELVKWIEANPEMDAIVCENDALAGVANKAINKAGRSVPDDLMLGGIGNNLVYMSMIYPSLTTIDFDMKEIARRAIRLIGDIQNGRKPARGWHEIVEGHIVLGGSTARIKRT